ncbi:MAG TPA: cyclic nucleotide-binding domain-containing protein [Polyangiaceae bacterium]|nr:cyclic nucleotide-binding domain-containing protein [Polyangiaceae bacterium]
MANSDISLQRTSREVFLSILAGDTQSLETWVIDRMTSVVEEEDVPAGKRLFVAGELPDYILFVGDGSIRFERPGAPPWIVEGRRVIGAFDALTDHANTRTATAVTPLHLLRLRADVWLELLEESFGLARASLRNAVRHVSALIEQFWSTQEDARAPAMLKVPKIDGPLTFVDRVAVLSGAPLLRSAGIQVIVELAEAFFEVTFEAGDAIFQRGVPGGQAFLVLEGEAVGTRHDPELRVHFGPGSWVGGVATLGPAILAWEAHAVTHVRALSVRLEDYLNVMEEHFDLVRSALSELARMREVILAEFESNGRAFEL